MRLLSFRDDGDLTLTRDLRDNIPAYAILSHTWGDDEEEVTFQDVRNGRGQDKGGYQKILLCGKQAAAHGLKYFWVDSCCIEKSGTTELSEALNSMFRWYKKSEKCYVYLADVSDSESLAQGPAADEPATSTWIDAFKNSRWFTRGWTLQELIAPLNVEFFSEKWNRLGDKTSLQQEIHDITGIPIRALQGNLLSDFSPDELMSWSKGRETKREEDMAYCMLGMVNVFLLPIYGEGKDHALLRLREEIDKRRHGQQRVSSDSQAIYYIPFRKNNRFVGRDTILKTLQEMLLSQQDGQKVAIVGLGGAGKTQVALQLAYWVKETHPDVSIFWIPALNESMFEQAYTEIAKLLGLETSDDEHVKEQVKRHLNSENSGRWLVIVDNADSHSTVFGCDEQPGLYDFLPENDHGSILFTTRVMDVAIAAAGSNVVDLAEMTEEEGKALFQKSVIRQQVLRDEKAVVELLTELTCLPLAMTQAIAYLNRNPQTNVQKYLSLLRNTDSSLRSLMSREFRDDTRYRGQQNAAASTWLVSFQQIQEADPTAADMLAFISQIEPKAIPRSILPYSKGEEETEFAIGTLCGYAFLTLRNDDEMYEMHSLVHLAARIWVEKQGDGIGVTRKALCQIKKRFPSDDFEHQQQWRVLMPHALRILNDTATLSMKARYDLSLWVGRCLLIDGRVREGVRWLEETNQWEVRNWSDEHPCALRSQHALARAYQADGQIAKALNLMEHVVAVKRRRLTKEDPGHLASQDDLAGLYREAGQITEAVQLLEHVTAIQEKTLAEDDPDRLRAQDSLAQAYRADGQTVKAVQLLQYVTAIQDKTLSEEHPDRLASQHALGIAYRANRQVTEAVEVLEHVVAVQEKILAEEHPDRLLSEYDLARIYLADGRADEAVKLLQHVTAVAAKALPDDHHRRILYMKLLETALAKQVASLDV